MMLANVTSDVLSQLERFKESFLWAAAKGGRVEECESLVQMGTDVNWVSPEGDTALLAACRNGHVSAALCLLDQGASVNQAAQDGQTALHLSCRRGQEAVAEALILGGADVFARDNNGATAFESEGPHAPVGMLRRLNAVALRTSRRNRHHDDIGIDTTADSDYGPPDGIASSTRFDSNSDAETLRASASRGRQESNESNTPGWRRGSTGHQHGHHRTDDSHGDPDGIGSAGISTDHSRRNDGQRRGGSRTTFPCIVRKIGSAHTGSRQSSSFSIASRTGSSGGERFQSSDDEDSVAIAAAIASASTAASGAATASTLAPANSLSYSTMSLDTLVSTSIRSPHPSYEFGRTTAASWNAGADGGGGHGIVASTTSSSTRSTSTSRSTSNSSRSGDGRASSGHSESDASGGGRQPNPPATTPQYTQTATPTANATASGRLDGHGLSSAGLGRGHAQQWVGAGTGAASGHAPCPTIAASAATTSTSNSVSALGVAGGMGYDDGCGEALAEGCHASNDHVGQIRVLWQQEKESRLASEAKAEAIRDQSARLWNELVRSEKQVLSLEEGMASLREERDKMKATLSGTGFKGRSLPELEQLEKDLRKALEGVCGERDRIVQEQLAKEEQRLCVVCQEKERSVLLLPCRHLCVCRDCSMRPELTLCPLCRDQIAETLVVYS